MAQAGAVITCTNAVASLAKGATTSFSFVVTPSPLAANVTSQAFNLTFDATGAYNDPNPANNTAIANALTQERDADIAIGVITATGNVSGLSNRFIDSQDTAINYAVPLSNSNTVGTSTATNIVVTATVPAGASFVAQAGCAQVGSVISCSVPSIAKGGAGVLNLSVVPVPMSIPPARMTPTSPLRPSARSAMPILLLYSLKTLHKCSRLSSDPASEIRRTASPMTSRSPTPVPATRMESQ